jgi:hypothetical protein
MNNTSIIIAINKYAVIIIHTNIRHGRDSPTLRVGLASLTVDGSLYRAVRLWLGVSSGEYGMHTVARDTLRARLDRD